MKYGSVCSGIEAATVAWHPLGWTPAFYSEIDPFARAVLSHHYPDTPLHGDFTTIGSDDYGPIDLLVGGTPCQSFSIAGLRGGLDDDRGNLSLEFLRLADRKRPRWLVWENVPGVLSSNNGRDFGSILGGMAQLGYGFAYRVLDAQYVRVDGYPRAVPQRRRRVFVVGYLGDWRRAAAVLFERESLQGHSAPRRKAGKIAAPRTSARSTGGSGLGTDFDLDGGLVTAPVAPTLNAAFGSKMGLENQHVDQGCPLFVAHTLSGEGKVAPATSPCLRARGNASHRLDSDAYVACITAHNWKVRRLMPVECERLQGFPDGYTDVPYRGKPHSADGPRYKAIGLSMAVNVMRWIGRRISMVEELCDSNT